MNLLSTCFGLVVVNRSLEVFCFGAVFIVMLAVLRFGDYLSSS